MKKLCFITIYILFLFVGRAQDISDDYQTLSRMSSEKLMEEGRDYFEKREARKALSRFLIVGDRYLEGGSTEQLDLSIRALNNAGCVYKYHYYDYPQAYEYFTRAYNLCEESGNEDFMPVVLVNLGDLLNDYGVTYNSESILEEAGKLFNDCFEMSVETRNWELMTTAFFNLSNMNYDIDLEKYKEIFSPEIPSDTPDIEFVRLQYLGIKDLQEGNYPRARESFEKQLNVINTPWEAGRDSICVYMNIAETYKGEKLYDGQLEYLKTALEKAINEEIVELEVEIALQIAQCYKNLGETEEYEKYHDLYLEKREEMHNARLASIGELKYISDLRREEANAKTANVKNRLLITVTVGLVIILLIIIAASLWIWRNNKALKRTNQSLYEKYNLLLGTETTRKEEKYARSKLDDNRKEELIERIEQVMNDASQICREDFTSKELAQLVGSNTTYVSQVINENYGVSFSTQLSTSRIKLVCRRINEGTEYSNFTIEGIANSVGFKSRTAFINAFKREVGLTPSQYIKMAAAEKEKEAKK